MAKKYRISVTEIDENGNESPFEPSAGMHVYDGFVILANRENPDVPNGLHTVTWLHNVSIADIAQMLALKASLRTAAALVSVVGKLKDALGTEDDDAAD